MILAQRIDSERVELLVDRKTVIRSPEYEVYQEPNVPEGFMGIIYIVEFPETDGKLLGLLVNDIPKSIGIE